ncbi:hypothetical protein TB2_032888 [Malus domestica]
MEVDVDGTLSYPKPQVNADSRPKPISIEEEQFMRVFYENKVQEVCTNFHFPHKVQATALIYFKRFYLQWSVMQHHPKTIINEIIIYQTLEFDLIVYAPYLSIEGFVNDIEEFCRLEDNQLQYLKGQQRRKLIKSCSQMHHSLSLLGRYEYDLSVKLLAVQAQNFVINHETYPLNLMQQVCRVADFERYLSSILSRQSSAHTISELVKFLNAIDSWAKRYKFPSDKDLKHINRNLKSCWGLSTHDESKKRDKKSKHKSKRSITNPIEPGPALNWVGSGRVWVGGRHCCS